MVYRRVEPGRPASARLQLLQHLMFGVVLGGCRGGATAAGREWAVGASWIWSAFDLIIREPVARGPGVARSTGAAASARRVAAAGAECMSKEEGECRHHQYRMMQACH